MALHESAEMYLETIYKLAQQRGSVRSIDVAEHMGYSKPSVSRAVSTLKKDGYITVEDDGSLKLTDSGLKVAQSMYERHTILTTILMQLGVDEETAADRSADQILQHTDGNVKIGDNAVSERSDGRHRFGRPPDDVLCLLSDAADLIGRHIHRNNAGLTDDDPVSLHIHKGIGRSEVNTDIFGKKHSTSSFIDTRQRSKLINKSHRL